MHDAEHFRARALGDRLGARRGRASRGRLTGGAHRAKWEVGEKVAQKDCAVHEETVRRRRPFPIAIRERLERRRPLNPRLADRSEEERLPDPRLRLRE